MPQTIQIKRSTSTASPSSLANGELAYSSDSNKLFIGRPGGGTGDIDAIGGKLYTDMLDHTAGTLTASSAVLTDANSKVDALKTANLTIGANSITSASGDVDIVANANLDIDASTIDLSTQATEFKIKDAHSTAFTIAEGSNNYVTLNTTNGAEEIRLNKAVNFAGAFKFPTTDGTNTQALLTNGSGVVTWGDVTTVLNIGGDSGTAAVSQLIQTFTVAGTDPIDTVASGQTLTISVRDATATAKGVASFDGTDFTVSSGAVSVNATTLGTTAMNPGATTSDIAGLTSLGFGTNNISLTGTTVSTGNNNNLNLSPNGDGVVKVPSGYKARSEFDANTLVTKEYVDALKQALDIKDSVTVATTANLGYTYDNTAGTLTATSNGAVTLDTSVALDTVGIRVLVKDQSTGAQNGIYSVTTVGDASTAIVLTRTIDANVASELTGGTFVFVETGTAGGDNGYVFTHDGTPTLGTTNLTVSQFSGAGQVIAGDGFSKSGNELTVNVDNKSIATSADALRIKGIGGTAVGDLLVGVAANGGYSALAKPSGDHTASDYILSMTTAGVAKWGNTLNGGTF